MKGPTLKAHQAHYPAGSHLVELLRSLDGFEWFTPNTLSNQELVDLLKRHFRLIVPELTHKEDVTRRKVGIKVLAAPIGTLAARFYRLQLPTQLAGESGELWRTTLERITAQLHQEALAVKERFTPPLFPVTGNPRVGGKPILASREQCAKLSRSADEKRALWALMCTVEEDVWNAILWQLVKLTGLDRNPYYALLELYSAGIYPIGLDGDTFLVSEYSSAETSEEMTTSSTKTKDVSIVAYIN
jgi:hypothetical protein